MKIKKSKREIKLNIKKEKMDQRERKLEELVEMCLDQKVLFSNKNNKEEMEMEKWLR